MSNSTSVQEWDPSAAEAWPVRCPVDDRWSGPNDKLCSDCGQDLGPLRALSALALDELRLVAASSTVEDAELHAQRADALVDESEPYLMASGEALVQAAAYPAAIARYQGAIRLAPRRSDLKDRLAELESMAVASASSRPSASVSSRPWLVPTSIAAAAVLVFAAGIGSSLLLRPPGTGATATAPIAAASLSPQPSASGGPPAPTSQPTRQPPTSQPTLPPPDNAQLVRRAIDEHAGDQHVSVEVVGPGIIRVAGLVADATTRDLILEAAASVDGVESIDSDGLVVRPLPHRYFVRRGDTLWDISARLFGDPTLWPRLVDANPGLSPRDLRAGQILVVPDRPTP